MDDVDWRECQTRVVVERSDDWMTDDAGQELYVVPLWQLEREGSDRWEHCRPEAADCTPGCKHRQEDQSAEECREV